MEKTFCPTGRVGSKSAIAKMGIMDYLSYLAAGLRQTGHERTAETYIAAMNSFRRYRHGVDIRPVHLTSAIVESYESWLHARGLMANTISFYMRVLRAGYYRWADETGSECRRIFRRVYTGIDHTPKRALTVNCLRRINSLDLSAAPHLQLARDLFMFSFFTRGMAFVDMAFLRKSDLRDNVLSYRRHKTGRRVTLNWEEQMAAIARRYANPQSPFILPIIRRPGLRERSQYRGSVTSVNRLLKVIGEMARTPLPLTTYVARHSWATIARQNNVPLSVISEGLGHSSERITGIYLAEIDRRVIDTANRRIICSV